MRAKRRRQAVILGSGAAALVLVLLGFVALSGNQTAVAADFELDQLDGAAINLSDYRGSPVALTFMHSW